MARGTFYAVFVIPAVISVVFATTVMAGALNEPDLQGSHTMDSIGIVGLEDVYAPADPVKITVTVDDPRFDCGDLYITIYDSTGAVVSQNGYFDQCYVQDELALPSDDIFSEMIDSAGSYYMRVEINDIAQEKSIFTTATFEVR